MTEPSMHKPVSKSEDLVPAWEVGQDVVARDDAMYEAALFLNKMDGEGGLYEYLMWGGVDAFPAELRDQAQAFADAEYALRSGIGQWAAIRGVLA